MEKTRNSRVALPEAKFRGLLESAPDAIVIVDSRGDIVVANSQAGHLFGYSQVELLGQSIEMLLPERLRDSHQGHRGAFSARPLTRPMGSGLDLVARRKDGSEFPVEISLSPFETGEGMLVTAVVRDVTERKRAAEELERQVQQRTIHLQALLEFSQLLLRTRSLDGMLDQAIRHALAFVPDAHRGAIYLYDEETGDLTLHASAGFREVPRLRVPVEMGILGLALTTRRSYVLNSVADYRSITENALRERWERTIVNFQLDQAPTGAMVIPLVAHDQAIGALILMREGGNGAFATEERTALETLANLTAAAISEERSRSQARSLSTQVASLEEQQREMAERLSYAEAGMLQAARLAAVGQLAASIAHEINNPLYAARNCLYLLEEDLPEKLRSLPYLGLARDQLDRIAGIIGRMRNFYRPARGEMAPHNLNYLLEETLAVAGLNLRHGAVQMIFTPSQDLPEVVCNGDQLRQVFLNLVMNAIDAMPDGGTLTVRTEGRPIGAIVEVRDTGVGIPKDIRERMFEPFFTNKPSGTGLGLAISAHIVTQHGGRIEVESEEEQGSTFRVLLPYQPSA